MKYAVQQYFYDSGNTKVIPPVEVPDTTEDFFEEKDGCDYYRDVFDTREEADEFYQEALEA